MAISRFTYTGTVLKFLHESDALVLDMALPMSTVHTHSALHLLLIHSLRTFSSPNRCGVEALSILLLKSLLMIEKCLRFMKIPFYQHCTIISFLKAKLILSFISILLKLRQSRVDSYLLCLCNSTFYVNQQTQSNSSKSDVPLPCGIQATRVNRYLRKLLK